MTGVVEEIGLDDENRTYLAGLRAYARLEIGKIENPAEPATRDGRGCLGEARCPST
jgi:hypothetical protein